MKLENLIGMSALDPDLLNFLRQLEGDLEIFKLWEDDPSDSNVLVLKKTGLQIMFDKAQKVNVIHINSTGMKGYDEYAGELPQGLSFQMSQAATNALLGAPSRTGGPIKAIIGEEIHFWDRWDYDRYVLHVQYPEEKDAITQITIMSVDRAP